MGLHQKSFQPARPSTRGRSRAVTPNSCGTRSSARKAPAGPMKLRAGPVAPALKKGAGSWGLKVARLMSNIRPKPKDKNPRSSAPRDDRLVSVPIVLLDLHHHGDDHRPALGAAGEEATRPLPHPLLGQLAVQPLLLRPGLHRLLQQPPRLRPQLRLFARVHKAAGDDLGGRLQLARLSVPDHDRDHDPVRGELPAVPNHDVLHLARPPAAEEAAARPHPRFLAPAPPPQAQALALPAPE